ncbi:type VII secretion protein EccCa [Mycolicibacterium flavescens]|uniref:Type VII secretion protein EccC n=1 Tax=Mycolicibacterium flavescens TaxID=1776 RepID=A0A1E3R7I1_MYCFV|nr:type VII secretion protein EccCa [Mycolicibacterium flavescens]ODQ85823.1 type VII secretion protein EccC [Mycolicibacterium flavescens]
MEPNRAQREVVLTAPPALPKPVAANPVARLLPVAMLVAAVGMIAVYFTAGSGTGRSPMFMFFPVMMLMSVLGTVAYGARGGAGRSAEIDANRRNYLRYLDRLDDDLLATTAHQHRAQRRRHPPPESLWAVIGSVAPREPDDADFCRVRIGTGDSGLCTPLREPELGAADEQDPVTVSALRALIAQRSVVADMPVTVSLTAHKVVAVQGDPQHARGVVRAVVCQLAAFHGPESVRLAVAGDLREWDWLKWLPHFGDGRPGRHTVVIVDGPSERATAADGVTALVIDASNDRAVTVSADGREVVCRPDGLSRAQAVVCARRLAARGRRSPENPGTRSRGWLQLIGAAAPEDITESRWTRRGDRQIQPVPIGVTEDGEPVHIDINEAARGGIGPHGLCVGATGSGKSELLRTLVLGMITTHPPDVLNLVLIDFKGGATFLGFERARHVAAIITNLADEAHLVTRMNDALAGEVHRRQEVLRAAGNYANVTEYARARSSGAPLPPLPALFIVVDEFSELLSQHPDFAELFVAIGRLGRSLGIHLLLASQRLDEGRLRGLDTHLSYRICLKTFSAGESRAVLGVTDAHTLPGTPGAAYLKTAAGELVRFQTAFVSEPGPPPRGEDRGVVCAPAVFTAAPPAHREAAQPTSTVLDAVLDRIADKGVAAHPVWLPPLSASPTLDMLGRSGAGVPIGLVDNPFEQRRDLLFADVSGGAGNVAIVGAPQSGKSTAARTLLLALAQDRDPTDIAFYCLDFGGGALTGLALLPHVGSVAGRAEADLCRRTVAVLESVIRSREDRFRALGIDSMAEYRARRCAGHPGVADDPHGQVYLVVDGWAHLRQQFDALEAPITAIAAQGPAFGVHVVITASRWAELRPALKDQIATRIELRLGDPAESEMDRRRARTLCTAPPGRGLTADGREMVIALPRFDGVPSATGLSDAIAAAVDRHRRRWDGARAPRIELLPTLVTQQRLIKDVASEHDSLLVGLSESDLQPVAVDFVEHAHLLALGEAACGKTSLLRLVCREVVRTRDPQEAQLEIVDFRRSLLGVVETGHLSGYSASPAALETRLPKLLAQLQSRMPGEDVTQQQLRDRSWWSGPEIFLVVDDYDLVAASTGSPLTPLADVLPHAVDLGLHLVVARRSGGAARAMFDPVLARMRELGCVGVMMSASPDDGPLLGSVRPSPLPAGRATLITRGDGERLIQVGWTPPP